MFPVNQVIPEDKKDHNLVCITSDGFEGKLIEELPGLLNWVLEVDCSHAIRILSDKKKRLTASLEEVWRASEGRANQPAVTLG